MKRLTRYPTMENRMRKRTLVTVAAFVALLPSACGQDPPADPAAEREHLEQRQNEFFSALADRDAERTAMLFSEDAVMHVANMPAVEGREAIRAFYGNMFNFLSASRATSERLHVAEGGELAYSIGRSANEFRGAEGPVEYAGKYLLVWRKHEGEWLIEVYSVSSNQPG